LAEPRARKIAQSAAAAGPGVRPSTAGRRTAAQHIAVGAPLLAALNVRGAVEAGGLTVFAGTFIVNSPTLDSSGAGTQTKRDLERNCCTGSFAATALGRVDIHRALPAGVDFSAQPGAVAQVVWRTIKQAQRSWRKICPVPQGCVEIGLLLRRSSSNMPCMSFVLTP
jgi:hypothetical protein